jgi:hypothetical protein
MPATPLDMDKSDLTEIKTIIAAPLKPHLGIVHEEITDPQRDLRGGMVKLGNFVAARGPRRALCHEA